MRRKPAPTITRIGHKLSTQIHPSAVIEDGCTLGEGVKIGPFCHVGPQVVLGNGVELLGQVSVQGETTIGDSTRIFPFASVGSEPQEAGEAWWSVAWATLGSNMVENAWGTLGLGVRLLRQTGGAGGTGGTGGTGALGGLSSSSCFFLEARRRQLRCLLQAT